MTRLTCQCTGKITTKKEFSSVVLLSVEETQKKIIYWYNSVVGVTISHSFSFYVKSHGAVDYFFFMTETATRTSCRGLGEAGSVAEPTTSTTTRRLPPFFRPLLTLLAIREQEQEVVSSSDGASALPPSSGPSQRRQSDDRPNTDRMGNCLKSPTSDDVSLLREGPPSRFGH